MVQTILPSLFIPHNKLPVHYCPCPTRDWVCVRQCRVFLRRGRVPAVPRHAPLPARGLQVRPTQRSPPRRGDISNTRQGRHGERGLPGEPVRAGAVAGVLRVRAPRRHRPRLRGHPAVGQECRGGGDIIYIYLSTYIQTGSLFEMLFYVLC